ncbi:ABC transporter permease [Polyangium aurulentum]|uniref:ABC transporter permease n=1 Tax=Polyangium aurulentum TaxID=2567896 RepID=UPI0010AED56B|nr:ABC transporter permease [Polyangium aurulentum]UQA63333.1 ABC transporter permease [Polyangium aurulentum]
MNALIAVVFRKEMKDHLRDRRSLMSALVMPIFGALVFMLMFTVVASWARAGKPLVVPVLGREHAPSLIAFLQRNGATLTDAPPDYEALVQAGKLDAVLVIPPDYGEDFSAGHTASVQLVLDNSRNEARVSNRRLRTLLEGYSGLVASQRLFARGVTPELLQPVRIDEVDLATPERMAANLLTMIPLFLVLTAFVGGMNVAIDAMAGERERGSLEPLLINPVHRGALVVGKWLATVALACIAVLVCMAAFLLVLKRVPLQDLGVKTRFDATAVIGMLATVIPLTFFASAGQMLVSTYARSFKEAQTYLQVLLLLPTLPGMLLSFSPVQAKAWMFAVPVFGQQLLVGEVMRGQAIGAAPFVLAAVGCIIAAAICLLLTARLLNEERIIFGRS